MRMTSLRPVSLKVGERVGAMETPSIVIGSRKWSLRVIVPAKPMKRPLMAGGTQKGSRFMVGDRERMCVWKFVVL